MLMILCIPDDAGRKRIKQLAQGMKLSDRLSEAAQRWFNLAVSTNFVKGRKSGYVIAACLYITCRMEKTHHMLIDFSDLLQVSRLSFRRRVHILRSLSRRP